MVLSKAQLQVTELETIRIGQNLQFKTSKIVYTQNLGKYWVKPLVLHSGCHNKFLNHTARPNVWIPRERIDPTTSFDAMAKREHQRKTETCMASYSQIVKIILEFFYTNRKLFFERVLSYK